MGVAENGLMNCARASFAVIVKKMGMIVKYEASLNLDMADHATQSLVPSGGSSPMQAVERGVRSFLFARKFSRREMGFPDELNITPTRRVLYGRLSGIWVYFARLK